MAISFADSVRIPDDVLISNLQEESVILNLISERYFGLDNIGTRMLSVLSNSESIEAAYETLAAEYDVIGLVRLVVVLGTIFGFGSLLVAYIVAWVLMPEA